MCVTGQSGEGIKKQWSFIDKDQYSGKRFPEM